MSKTKNEALDWMSDEERAKAEEKRRKRAEKAQKAKVAEEVENQLEYPIWDKIKTREGAKKELENVHQLLRSKRKAYLEDENLQNAKLSHGDLVTLELILKTYSYDKFPLQISAIEIEGLKYPVRELKRKFEAYEDNLLSAGYFDIGKWLSLLNKDYVPKGAWRLLEKHKKLIKSRFGVVLVDSIERWGKQELADYLRS